MRCLYTHITLQIQLSKWWLLLQTNWWYFYSVLTGKRIGFTHELLQYCWQIRFRLSSNPFNPDLSQSPHRSRRSGLHCCDQRFYCARAWSHPRQKHPTQRSCCQRRPPAVRWQDPRSESLSGVRWGVSSIVMYLIAWISVKVHMKSIESECMCVFRWTVWTSLAVPRRNWWPCYAVLSRGTVCVWLWPDRKTCSFHVSW